MGIIKALVLLILFIAVFAVPTMLQEYTNTYAAGYNLDEMLNGSDTSYAQHNFVVKNIDVLIPSTRLFLIGLMAIILIHRSKNKKTNQS